MGAQLKYQRDGDRLIITANNAARAELSDGYCRNGYRGAEDVMADLGFNGANGGLSFFPPERIPEAMTDMPMLADWTMEDDDSTSIWGPVWGFPDYCVIDPWEVLKNTGRVEFVCVAYYGSQGAHLPAPCSDEASEINGESYRNCLNKDYQGRDYPPAN